MPIPPFSNLLLPLLRHLADGLPHPNRATFDALAAEMSLSEEERTRLLPSGRQSVFANRVAWAKSHLRRAGLVEAPQEGVYRITDRGREVLAQNPPRIDLKFLDQFPGHREFRTGGKPVTVAEVATEDDGMTPQEHVEFGTRALREELAAELLRRVKACSPAFFERLVVELVVAMGYGGSLQDAGRAIGRSGDEGIDGIINEDRLGLDVIYLQAKKWDSTVGRPEIQKFAGALQGQRAKKGIFITTATFSQEARRYAEGIESRIVLIDGQELAEYMIDHGIGVAEVGVFVVKRLDSDYFEQE